LAVTGSTNSSRTAPTNARGVLKHGRCTLSDAPFSNKRLYVPLSGEQSKKARPWLDQSNIDQFALVPAARQRAAKIHWTTRRFRKFGHAGSPGNANVEALIVNGWILPERHCFLPKSRTNVWYRPFSSFSRVTTRSYNIVFKYRFRK